MTSSWSDAGGGVERRRSGAAAEAWALAVAAGVAVGVVLGAGPLRMLAAPAATAVAGLGIGGLAGLRRSPALLVVAAVVTGAWSGARAEAGYVALEPGPVRASVTVVDDPEPRWPSWRVDVRAADGRRLRAVGYGREGGRIARAEVGDRFVLVGTVRPGPVHQSLRTRHIAAVVAVDRLEPQPPMPLGPGSIFGRVTEAVRSRVVAGAEALDHRYRPLYTGLVLGDDRFQPIGQRVRFRQAGLSHLLAVSGQNVAFVLAAVGPVLRRLPLGPRMATTVVVLCIFAAATRYEPSVLRATAAALVAAWAAFTGRERTGIRVLAAAVSGLLLIDPFLVGQVGFRLSVAASAGILVVGPPLARRLPGPRPVAEALAVTMAAQLAVGPILVATFGPVSVATVPANLAAGWAAAAVMVLGLTVGVVAGAVPPAAAGMLMTPVEWLLWWIDAVATWGARLPAPRIGSLEGLAVAGAALLARRPAAVRDPSIEAGQRGRFGGVVRAGSAVVAAVVLAAAVPRPPPEPGPCGPGAHLLPGDADHPSVLVLGEEISDGVIEDCVVAGVRSVDLVLVERGDHRAGRVVAGLAEVVDLGVIRAPPIHRVVGARRLLEPGVVATAWGPLTFGPSDDQRRLEIGLPTMG